LASGFQRGFCGLLSVWWRSLLSDSSCKQALRRQEATGKGELLSLGANKRPPISTRGLNQGGHGLLFWVPAGVRGFEALYQRSQTKLLTFYLAVHTALSTASARVLQAVHTVQHVRLTHPGPEPNATRPYSPTKRASAFLQHAIPA
jgi:hypothetical protein